MTRCFLTWHFSLQFLFHLSKFSGLLLQRFLQICTAQLKGTRAYSRAIVKSKEKYLLLLDQICLYFSYLAAIGVVCDEGCQELDGVLHRIYGFVHQSSHSKLHNLTVPTQG